VHCVEKQLNRKNHREELVYFTLRKFVKKNVPDTKNQPHIIFILHCEQITQKPKSETLQKEFAILTI
jgi:hypothetical protein